MKSKIAKRILDETPQEVRDEVKAYGDRVVNSAHGYTEGSEPINEMYYIDGPDEFVKGEPEKTAEDYWYEFSNHTTGTITEAQFKAAIRKCQNHVNEPRWYTKEQMHHWLKRGSYSEQIANELSEKWADDLQGAFNKGFEKASKENERLRKLIEKAFDAGRKSDYEPYDESWKQFKKDNGL